MNIYKENNDYIERLIVESELLEFLEIIDNYNDCKYNSNLINEAMPDMGAYFAKMAGGFLSDASSGMLSGVSEFFIDLLVHKIFGFNPTTLLGRFITEIVKEFIENVVIANPTNISKYFDDKEACKYISQDLILVLGKSGGDIMIKSLIGHIKSPEFVADMQNSASGEIELQMVSTLLSALDSELIKAGSKIIKEMFQSKILERLSSHVEKAICDSNLSISDMMKEHFGFLSSSEASPAESQTKEEE